MKVRVKETGEIINIADYARVTLDKCDSYGNPIELSFDDVEILQEMSDNIDWVLFVFVKDPPVASAFFLAISSTSGITSYPSG